VERNFHHYLVSEIESFIDLTIQIWVEANIKQIIKLEYYPVPCSAQNLSREKNLIGRTRSLLTELEKAYNSCTLLLQNISYVIYLLNKKN